MQASRSIMLNLPTSCSASGYHHQQTSCQQTLHIRSDKHDACRDQSLPQACSLVSSRKPVCNTPATVHEQTVLQVGIGAFVLNEAQEVLVVQERRGPLRGKV